MSAWVTLLTRPGYLSGVRTLNRSLRLVGSAHPLVVMVTPGLDRASRRVLADDGIAVREVEAISPDGGERGGYADARFGEVWTKLAAWGLVEHERVVVLDGDMLVLDPDAGVLAAMLRELTALDDPARYPFAEQDYLDERYAGRWRPLPWVYNALKTLPHQHPSVWDEAAVRNVHYILDKPWEHPLDPGSPHHALERAWWEVADGLPQPSPVP